MPVQPVSPKMMTMVQMPLGMIDSARFNTAAKVKINKMPGMEVNTL